MKQLILVLGLFMAMIVQNSPLQASVISAYGYIPVSAYAPGDYGTFWQTDLYVQNFTNEAINISLIFYSGDASYSTAVTYQFQPWESMEFPNAVHNLFFYEGSGWIVADASPYYNPGNPDSAQLGIYSRTYTTREGVGTFGQGIDNQYPIDATPDYFWGIQNNPNYRTNLGITTNWWAGNFTVNFYDSSGILVDSLPVYVPAASNVQFRITQDINNGSIIVISQDNMPYMSYISRVDNGSGDAIFMPGSVYYPAMANTAVPSTMWHGICNPNK